jgi:hypothetical protein
MNQIQRILKLGWTIEELKFDRWQSWYYAAAGHETGETPSVKANGPILTTVLMELCGRAIASTPKWYIDSLKEIK